MNIPNPWGERPIPLPLSGALSCATTKEFLPACSAEFLLANKVRGMLLGVAIGDSLGNTSEGMLADERRALFGEIRDYLPHPREDMRCIGFPSDDTQLTFWTLESLLRCGCLDVADLAKSFVGPRIFGIGKTMTAFILACRGNGVPWSEAWQASAGNGALMRMAPVLLPYLREPNEALWHDVIAATVLTHRDEAAVVASVGFVGLLMECLGLPEGEKPEAEWWVERFLYYGRAAEKADTFSAHEHEKVDSTEFVSTNETEACGQNGGASSASHKMTANCASAVPYFSRMGDGFRGTLCDRVEQTVLPALQEGMPAQEGAQRWGSGAYLLETVPCVLHILALHSGDPEQALIRAVNDTYDNDTIASLVGTALGALYGADAFPARWQEPLLGRTVEADDGHVQELIAQAIESFVISEKQV